MSSTSPELIEVHRLSSELTKQEMPKPTAICRAGCGACCVEPSISTPIPGMPEGKPAGVRCIQLNEDNLCRLFGTEERPKVCEAFTAELSICGNSNAEAFITLQELEAATVNI